MQTSKFQFSRQFSNCFILLLFISVIFIFSCAPNHFLCYNDAIEHQPSGAGLVLQDQFRTTKALVGELENFYNPVRKTKRSATSEKPKVSKIRYKDHHLMGYHIETDQTEVRKVWVKNQFSKKWQKLEVHQSFKLLVPAQKIEPNFHKPPKGLDHYICYEVVGENMDVQVALKDQFRSYRYMPTGQPVVLCNPVKKTHGDKVFPIKNRKWHLVGYKLDYQLEQTTPATASCQIGKESMRLNLLDMILVPSLKRTVEPGKG